MQSIHPNVAELVGRMPATDKELEAQKAQAATPDAQLKPRSLQGSKFTGPEPEVAEKAFDELLAGGRDSLVELIGLIRAPASPDFQDYKAEYFLHCLVVYTGRPGKEQSRKMLIAALVSQVGNEQVTPYVRGFLARELQWIGDRTAVPALGKLLTDEQCCADAASALVAIRDGAAEQLRKALPKTEGKCRLIVLQNLAVLRDRSSKESFRRAVTDPDREIRLTGAWGLAQITDADAVDLVLEAADVEPCWERIKATQACLLLAENLIAAGNKSAAAKIYTHLCNTRKDKSEKYIHDLAANAMAAI